MDFYVGLVLLLMCGGVSYYNYGVEHIDPLTWKYHAWAAISGVGGAWLTLSNIKISKLGRFFESLGKNKMNKSDSLTLEDFSDSNNKELLDYLTLSYLQRRCSEMGCQEAVNHVVELNTIMFSSKVDMPSAIKEPEWGAHNG